MAALVDATAQAHSLGKQRSIAYYCCSLDGDISEKAHLNAVFACLKHAARWSQVDIHPRSVFG
jgi:23S rRNA G2445 N2-methylase RlmL